MKTASIQNAVSVPHCPQAGQPTEFEKLVESCGKPAKRGDNWAIYHGDCMELLSRIPAGSARLTVTSPPYNIGKEYESRMDLSDYICWCENWIKLIHTATSADGAFWLNLGYVEVPAIGRAVPLPYLLWDKIPFYLIQEIVWNYGAGVSAKKAFSPRNEKFLWYAKDPENKVFNLDEVRDKNVKYPNQMKNGKLRCNPLGKNPSDVWQFPKVTSGKDRSSSERTAHPAQFPVAVIDRIIRACSNPGDTILDPFVGSGSSLEAAISSGRSAIGFEIRADYVDLAASRLKSLQNQPSLL